MQPNNALHLDARLPLRFLQGQELRRKLATKLALTFGAILELGQETDPIARLAQILGVVFLIGSFAVFVLLLVTFSKFLTEPDAVFSISLFTDFLEADAPAVTMTIEGRDAIVDFDPTLRLILVIFVGAISILALGSILHACIGGGLMLVKFARQKIDTDGT